MVAVNEKFIAGYCEKCHKAMNTPNNHCDLCGSVLETREIVYENNPPGPPKLKVIKKT
jgi:uncharacterized OB-fold protein